MAFRFQKRIRIAPGVRLNLSKSGVSTSLGPRGASVNIGKDGTKATVGIPGTGLSHTTQLGKAAPTPFPAQARSSAGRAVRAVLILLTVAAGAVWLLS